MINVCREQQSLSAADETARGQVGGLPAEADAMAQMSQRRRWSSAGEMSSDESGAACEEPSEPIAATSHSAREASTAEKNSAAHDRLHSEDLSTNADTESTSMSSCHSLNSADASSSLSEASDQASGRVSALRCDAPPSPVIPTLHLRLCFLGLCNLPPSDRKLAKVVGDTITLLKRCRYPLEDICSTLAHASVYFSDMRSRLFDSLDLSVDIGNIVVLLIFIAHGYVMDKCCPLRYWREHVLQGWSSGSRSSSMKGLDASIMRLLSQRGYVLRISDADLRQRYSALFWAGYGGAGGKVVPISGCFCVSWRDLCSSISLLLRGPTKRVFK